ncbi:hypothetical protein PIB30_011885 [Stylosanthes scabra]|uniref:Uncharacterized protein n=1 Tax=Stylosanthes scabra TaxID=79078 RepID=A0ABU6U6U8_9FABA|nr:hypothetical protein [Stylosanthes scabra]
MAMATKRLLSMLKPFNVSSPPPSQTHPQSSMELPDATLARKVRREILNERRKRARVLECPVSGQATHKKNTTFTWHQWTISISWIQSRKCTGSKKRRGFQYYSTEATPAKCAACKLKASNRPQTASQFRRSAAQTKDNNGHHAECYHLGFAQHENEHCDALF